MAMERTCTDQLGRIIRLSDKPLRIVSLVPSQTELLYHLGLDQEIVGQTLFCIHPAHAHENKPRVGGTKNLNLDKIRTLQPTLIIANKEENTQSDIEILQKEFPVWISDIQNLQQALQMIQSLGSITGKEKEAALLVNQIELEFQTLSSPAVNATALYLIWQKPFMAAGSNTFIDQMMKICGFQNLITHHRYPQISPAEIINLNPKFILLSSEPFPFSDKHRSEIAAAFPEARVVLVNGEMFSWYGSRMLQAANYFRQLQKMLF